MALLYFQELFRCGGLSGASPFPTKQSQQSAHEHILSNTLAARHALPYLDEGSYLGGSVDGRQQMGWNDATAWMYCTVAEPGVCAVNWHSFYVTALICFLQKLWMRMKSSSRRGRIIWYGFNLQSGWPKLVHCSTHQSVQRLISVKCPSLFPQLIVRERTAWLTSLTKCSRVA